ncbi:MAG: hemolysin family protein [Halieaceae bacterium]|jgi:CBS domain containing-hemolysin-like protein|nr:hemolysin family protein [Halieaceae bacterium]
MTTLFMLLGLVLLLLLQGFFSGSEIALVNCDRNKLRFLAKQGDAGAKLALRLLENPEVVLSTTLVGTNISLVMLTSIATTTLIAAVGERGDVFATILLIPLTLVLGEVVPKSVFQQRASELTPRIVYPLYAFSLLFFPVVFVFSRIARLAARLFGRGDPGAGIFTMRSQLRAILDAAEGGANVDVFDRTRIRNVVRFGEFMAGDVMLPAAEMTAIDADAGLQKLFQLSRRTGDLIVPVYEGERSQIIGIISLSVWEMTHLRGSEQALGDFVKPALFVPSQQPLVELLPILRSREDQSAIVVDEYGSAVGLVNVDQIIETIVGQVNAGASFQKREDAEGPNYEALGEGHYLLNARLPVAEVNELLGTSLFLSEARTIGGLLVARLRHVPTVGECLTMSGYKFTVVEVGDRAITTLRAEPSA